MSNYTGKRRAGGGLLTTQILNRMAAAIVEADTTIRVTYERPVAAATLGDTNFLKTPDAHTSESVTQVSANVIDVHFGDLILDAEELTYTGNAAAFQSPQTISTV